jgi:hypothetical protein
MLRHLADLVHLRYVEIVWFSASFMIVRWLRKELDCW